MPWKSRRSARSITAGWRQKEQRPFTSSPLNSSLIRTQSTCTRARPDHPGNHKAPDFDPLLAVHRIKKAEIIDRDFEFPKNYDFEKLFNREFGIIKEEAFEVRIEFTGWAAKYAAERIWSPDQKITKKKGGTIVMFFTASSEPELISWVLSFGDEAKLLKPDWLVDDVKKAVNRMQIAYSGST